MTRLLSYRQIKKRAKEAGGLLIGRQLLEGGHIIVDGLTEPNWWDRRLRNFFFRSGKHNKFLLKAWTKSKNTKTLVGLWHTHPEPNPNPSDVDYYDWKRTILHGEFVGKYLVFMIVGTEKIRLWKGDRNAKFVELEEMRQNVEDCYE